MTRREQVVAVILAAGLGTRMKSSKGKVRHVVQGMPLVVHVARAAIASGVDRVVVVVGHQAEEVEREMRSWLPDAALEFVLQASPRGTGHAVLMAEAVTTGASHLLILNGDVPGISTDSLLALQSGRTETSLTLATCVVETPKGYGRIVRNTRGEIEAIVEERDASPAVRALREINVGLYYGERSLIFEALHATGTENAQGEIYLTDIVAHAVRKGLQLEGLMLEEGLEIWGVNNRAELARVEQAMRQRTNHAWMLEGVTLPHPESVEIGPEVRIGQDTVIRGGCRISGKTRIGTGCTIDEGAVLHDVHLGEGVHVKSYCVMEEAHLGDHVAVGPFAHLRPGTRLDAHVKVGNFVETKKAHLREGAKASHLSYLGDCEIGEQSNIGAGTITCNYDGVNKFRTTLGKGVFIGSDTQLVAPVTVEDGAFVAAGTTVTGTVPAGALAISRTPQKNIEGWVERTEAKRKESR